MFEINVQTEPALILPGGRRLIAHLLIKHGNVQSQCDGKCTKVIIAFRVLATTDSWPVAQRGARKVRHPTLTTEPRTKKDQAFDNIQHFDRDLMAQRVNYTQKNSKGNSMSNLRWEVIVKIAIKENCFYLYDAFVFERDGLGIPQRLFELYIVLCRICVDGWNTKAFEPFFSMGKSSGWDIFFTNHLSANWELFLRCSLPELCELRYSATSVQ